MPPARPPGFPDFLSEDGWRLRWAKRHGDVARIKATEAYQRIAGHGMAPPDPAIDGIYASKRTWHFTYTQWRDNIYWLAWYLA